MPGMIANAEHQHAAEFGRKLESVLSAIVAAQNPEPTSLLGPLAAEPEQHSDDLITPARTFRMLLHTNPTRERGECLGTRAGASEDM